MNSAQKLLTENGQAALLTHLESLSAQEKTQLESQILSIPWEELKNRATPQALHNVSEIPVAHELSTQAIELGKIAFKKGKIAVFLLAGGAGTRFGSNGPKGCIKLFEDTDTTLYEYQAQKVGEINSLYGVSTPLIVATSNATHHRTPQHFKERNFFGLPKDSVHFVKQPSIPVFSESDELILESSNSLLMSPNGNGGCFEALAHSGTLRALKDSGIEFLIHVQVDNVHARFNDPGFVGLMKAKKLELGIKLIKMQSSLNEGLASVVICNEQVNFVEYSERTEEHKKPAFRWGSPSLFCWSIDFLSRVVQENVQLPYHKTLKQVDGQAVWKYERFMFDLAILLPPSSVCGLPISRGEFFPIKNNDDLMRFREEKA